MNYVFGPVPSRRLGQSLGIDTIPLKTCNWNCVYCQLGRTMPLTNVRQEYLPRANGALLYLPEVRAELAAADAVLPTLDAGNAELYRQINRPHPDCTYDRLVDGLIAFRAAYHGQLWVEVMLVRGLNDTEAALREIAAVLQRVQPDQVHINLPTRPPVETWVQPPDAEGLLRALGILGEIAHVVHPAVGSFDLSGYESVLDAVIGIITRHPLREDELRRALEKWSPGQVDTALEQLAARGQAQVVERYGCRFWKVERSRRRISSPM